MVGNMRLSALISTALGTGETNYAVTLMSHSQVVLSNQNIMVGLWAPRSYRLYYYIFYLSRDCLYGLGLFIKFHSARDIISKHP